MTLDDHIRVAVKGLSGIEIGRADVVRAIGLEFLARTLTPRPLDPEEPFADALGGQEVSR